MKNRPKTQWKNENHAKIVGMAAAVAAAFRLLLSIVSVFTEFRIRSPILSCCRNSVFCT